jgi:ActR/RegA family two-component response regulator
MLLPQEPYAVLEEPYPVSTELPDVHLPIHMMRTAQLIDFMKRPKILLVDDNNDELFQTRRSLVEQNCEVVSASCVTDALRQIATQNFDVLITDLHMPQPGDGFAVVTAMRHSQPQALTLVVSDYPDVQKAMNAILLQADEVLVKPFDAKRLAGLMDKERLTSLPSLTQAKEGLASILDRDVAILMQRWLARVELVKELAAIPLPASERAVYLPEMIRSITARLRGTREIEAADVPIPAAVMHGQCRYRQGYTAPMIVQESRLLQVSIFETVQRNLATVDFTGVLPDIMIIADEVDSQLKQTISSFLTMQREEVALASAVIAKEPASAQAN